MLKAIKTIGVLPSLVCAILLLAACNESPSQTRNTDLPKMEAQSSPVENTGRWIHSSDDGLITTSIGKLTFKNKPEDEFGNNGVFLDGQQILRGLISDDLRINGLSAIDYTGRITLLANTWSGGASCCSSISAVHLGRSGGPLSSIEVELSDAYEPDWKERNGSYLSAPFMADGSMMIAVLSPDGVSLRASDVIADQKDAPQELCTFMSEALSSSCKVDEFNERDCADIESSLSNLEGSWFRAASNDPGFDYKGFMQTCQNVCKGQDVNTNGFANLYCRKKDN